MPKKLFKRLMPDHHTIRHHKQLQFLGTLLHDPNLFHINRRSISGAVAVGLFCAWVPIPFQMVLAAIVAIFVRVNLPISAILVWISNPFTMPPMFYFAYLVGTWVLGIESGHFNFEPSFEWLTSGLTAIWQPFLLGCTILGGLSGALGYAIIRGWWRLSIVRHKETRAKRQDTKP